MALVPIPGVNEANLAAKIGTSVVHGLRQASQPPPWPNIYSSLLELLAILEQWNHRADITALYAEALSRVRQYPGADSPYASYEYGEGNISRTYVHEITSDSRRVLYGRTSPLFWWSGHRRRRAARRGLRTIL